MSERIYKKPTMTMHYRCQMVIEDGVVTKDRGEKRHRQASPKDYEKAERDLRHGLGIKPEMWAHRELLADIMIEQGRREEALEQLEIILRYQPNDREILRKLKEIKELIENQE